jgi:2'-5' RNA ligase
VWTAVGASNPLHAPERWVPHVTLARHASPDATEVLAGLRSVTGWFVGARSYDDETRTVTDLR